MIKTTKQKGEFGMKRTVYEAPVTELFRVELEGNFCASAEVENPNDATNGRIDNQKINDGFASDNFSSSWTEDL